MILVHSDSFLQGGHLFFQTEIFILSSQELVFHICHGEPLRTKRAGLSRREGRQFPQPLQAWQRGWSTKCSSGANKLFHMCFFVCCTFLLHDRCCRIRTSLSKQSNHVSHRGPSQPLFTHFLPTNDLVPNLAPCHSLSNVHATKCIHFVDASTISPTQCSHLPNKLLLQT